MYYIKNTIVINGHRLMVDLSSSKRIVSIRIRLAVNKNFNTYLIKNNLGKVAIGKARYLLNIVLCTWMFESSLFRIKFKSLFNKEHSLMVKFEASNFTFSVQVWVLLSNYMLIYYSMYFFFLFLTMLALALLSIPGITQRKK